MRAFATTEPDIDLGLQYTTGEDRDAAAEAVPHAPHVEIAAPLRHLAGVVKRKYAERMRDGFQ